MSDLLKTIAEQTLADLQIRRRTTPETVLRNQIEQMPDRPVRSLYAALKQPGVQIIAELKKASPSRGMIRPDFPYERLAEEYEANGAAAISVLTEPHYFQGAMNVLTAVSEKVHIPVLRKDFILDPYQLLEAKAIGADAALLIASLIPGDRDFQKMMRFAQELGLETLCEAHTQEEVRRMIDLGAGIIGVNCRDLHTFRTDLSQSKKLIEMIPDDRASVSESGIHSADDLNTIPADAFLIGEALMRLEHPGDFLRELRGEGVAES